MIPAEWVIIPGSSQQYAATPEGEIVRLPRTTRHFIQGEIRTRKYAAKVLDTRPDPGSGTPMTRLDIDGRIITASVPVLVCTAFHGRFPALGRPTVVHADGDTNNCRPDNLSWQA